jgi:4'-phosphopantetheinyl transferase
VAPEGVERPALLQGYRALLSAEERAQQRRFRFARNRHDYLVTRALVRTVLSRYHAIDPRAWRFARNAYGRPYVAEPAGAGLVFNVSHAPGLIACVVARDREVGLDIEDTTRRSETAKIADRYFSPLEVTALRALPAADQRARFFEYWTLKESYIKARGMGLSLPLDQFSFHLDEGGPVRITLDPRLADEPASWQFALFRPTGRHVMAVSIRRGRDPALAIALRETVPLVF